MLQLPPAAVIGLLTSGLFLLVGMITGIWKYFSMLSAENSEAPYYVNIAHRASLMYSSATLILTCLAYFSSFSSTVNIIAVVSPVLFFAIAIAMYVVAGIKNTSDNQVRDIDHGGKVMMIFLILAEVGGTLTLLLGAALTLVG